MKLFAKILGGLVSFFLLLLIFLIIYVEINQESLSNYLISKVNESINGEITIDNVNFNPIAHFPHQSISVHDVLLSDSENNKVVESEKIYLAINIFSLFRDTLQIYGLEVENAKIDLKLTKQNNLNLVEMFSVDGSEPESGVSDKSNTPNLFTSGIIPETVLLDNVLINYHTADNFQMLSYHIKNLETEYNLSPDTIVFSIDLNSRILNLPLTSDFIISDQDLSLNSKLLYTETYSLLNIDNALIQLNEIEFKLFGNVGFSDKKKSKIDFSLSDNEGLTSIFQLKNLDKKYRGGRIDLQGTFEHDPQQKKFNFGGSINISDISITNSKNGSSINDFNLSGSFNAGWDTSLVESNLIIDTLYYNSGQGRIDANLTIADFNDPRVRACIKGNQDIGIIADIFELNHMEGDISVFVDVNGKLDKGAWVPAQEDSLLVGFSDVSIDIDDLFNIKNLNGAINGSIKELKLDSIKTDIGRSDYLIVGSINNSQAFFSKNNTPASIKIDLYSDLFDLGELLEYIPTADAQSFKASFPYDFKDVFVSASTEVTLDMLKDFVIMPQFEIRVKEAKATIDGFLPPAKATNGKLNFVVPDSSLNIDITGFKVELGEYKLNGGVNYFVRRGITDSITITADIESLSPEYLLSYYDQPDQDLKTLNTIAGSFDVGMNFSGFNTSIDPSFAELNANKVEWRTEDDTLFVNDINIKVDSVYYNSDAELGPLSELGAVVKTEFYDISSSWLELDRLKSNIIVSDGVFKLNVLESTSLLQAGTGELVMAPFVKDPFYEFKYKIDSFGVEDLYERFNQPATIKGNVSVNIDIEAKGSDLDEISSEISGSVDLEGHDLELIGLNIDEVIRKLNRTQNFNLADIGAVVVAGPAGLLLTKGSDITSLLLINTKDSTRIEELISEWNIQNGELILNDVAFSTPKNRIAAKGNYSFVTDSLSVVIAVIDDKGHIQLHQTIYGESSNPEFSAIKPLRSLLKPVENLLVDVFMIDGDVFYDGKVLHPPKR